MPETTTHHQSAHPGDRLGSLVVYCLTMAMVSMVVTRIEIVQVRLAWATYAAYSLAAGFLVFAVVAVTLAASTAREATDA